MIRFQHEGNEYQIRVDYSDVGSRTVEVSIRGPYWDNTQQIVCFTGVARCSPKDNFSKRMGRKIALRRALSNTNRVFRKSAWQAYKAECRLP